MTNLMDHGFTPHVDKPRVVLICTDEGIEPMLLLSEQLASSREAAWQQLVLVHSQAAFPFRTRPSTIMVDGMPAGVIAAASLLDERGIASRLSSHADLPGCHDGGGADLAAAWLGTLNNQALNEVELFVCGTASLVQATEQVARRYGVACQVLMKD